MAEGERIVVLRAPIGYGKSVLLQQWMAYETSRNQLVAAVSCRSITGTTGSFWTHVAAAIETVLHRYRDDHRLPQVTPQSTTTPFEFVSQSLSRLRDPISLVLDDLDLVANRHIPGQLIELPAPVICCVWSWRCDRLPGSSPWSVAAFLGPP